MKYKYIIERQVPRIGRFCIGEDVFEFVGEEENVTINDIEKSAEKMNVDEKITIRRQDCTYD